MFVYQWKMDNKWDVWKEDESECKWEWKVVVVVGWKIGLERCQWKMMSERHERSILITWIIGVKKSRLWLICRVFKVLEMIINWGRDSKQGWSGSESETLGKRWYRVGPSWWVKGRGEWKNYLSICSLLWLKKIYVDIVADRIHRGSNWSGLGGGWGWDSDVREDVKNQLGGKHEGRCKECMFGG